MTTVTTEPAKRTGTPRDSVWIAHNKDGDGAHRDGLIVQAIFSTKLAALEYAVDRGLTVTRVRYGETLGEQVTE